MAGVPKVVMKFAKKIGTAPINWYPGHMASATRSIQERLSLMDLIIEVRDARLPLSSSNEDFQQFLSRKRRLLVLNKADLCNPNMIPKWKSYFTENKVDTAFVNAHCKDSIRLLQIEIRQCIKDLLEKRPTLLVLVVGIPNVGKSAIINGLHALNHSAQEKLKKAEVGPLPGVTLRLQGFKIGSHPSIYVLDTPGILVPNIRDLGTGLRLALTGAIKDSVVGEERLARFLLTLLNARQTPLKWVKSIELTKAKLEEDKKKLEPKKPKTLLELKAQAYLEERRSLKRKKPENVSDHNKDSVVIAVREGLLKTLTEFNGNLEDEDDMESLVDTQMHELRRIFGVPAELGDIGYSKVGIKLLNLYRIGRLGTFTLDTIPDEEVQEARVQVM